MKQIVGVLKQAEVGVPVAELIRKVGIEKLKQNPEQEVGFIRAAGRRLVGHNVQTAVDAADHRRLHHTNLSVKTHPKEKLPLAFRSVPCENPLALNLRGPCGRCGEFYVKNTKPVE